VAFTSDRPCITVRHPAVSRSFSEPISISKACCWTRKLRPHTFESPRHCETPRCCTHASRQRCLRNVVSALGRHGLHAPESTLPPVSTPLPQKVSDHRRSPSRIPRARLRATRTPCSLLVLGPEITAVRDIIPHPFGPHALALDMSGWI